MYKARKTEIEQMKEESGGIRLAQERLQKMIGAPCTYSSPQQELLLQDPLTVPLATSLALVVLVFAVALGLLDRPIPVTVFRYQGQVHPSDVRQHY